MDETDGHTFVAFRDDAVAKRIDFLFIERLQDLATGADAFVNNQPVVTRNKRRGQHDIEIILLETAFRAHFNHIAKAPGCHECGFRTASLNQCIGGKRRSVNDSVDLIKLHSSIFSHFPNAFDDGIFGKCIIRQHLG